MSPKRVFIVDGAPRNNGYTAELVDLVKQGVEDAGGVADVLHLRDCSIAPCLGCYGCYSADHPGTCVQNDDMQGAIERFYRSDSLVLATPLYFYTFSALLKAFIERLLPVTEPKPVPDSRTGMLRNAVRHPDKGPKQLFLLAAGAHRGEANMAALVETFNWIASGLDAKPGGVLLRPESHFLDYTASKPFTIRKIRLAFESAGREIVRNGAVSKETEQQAALPLTKDSKTYLRHFSTHWQIIGEQSIPPSDRDLVRCAVAEDLRVLMPELAACLDPQVAGDLEAVIEFDLQADIKDAAKDVWHLLISNRSCQAVAGPHPNPTTAIQTSPQILVDIIMQRLEVRRAIADRRLTVSGDRTLLAKLGRLFPPPSR